ncbi:MAG TPA: hypothetical protein PKN48_00105 [Bacteroidales bacterium]|nr:hypothetical protein [Bacteroidales bacterium]
MPRLANDISFDAGMGYQYSGTGTKDLKEPGGYTLANVSVDITGSTQPFSNDLLEMVKTAVLALQKGATSANILLRVSIFNSKIGVEEIHGFIPVKSIDILAQYKPFKCDHLTNLIDAHLEGQQVLFDYAKYLYGQDYDVNSIQITITDGVENASKRALFDIGAQLLKSVHDECLASHLSILIGINDTECKTALISFKDEAQISYYTGVADATPESLAKVAGIVSSSVSSQSSARGSGKSAQLTI